MSKIELKFGRKVVAWEDNVDPVKGRYIKYQSHEQEHWILDDAGSIMPFEHVKPDLSAPPMNGDEVEGSNYEDRSFERFRYIGQRADGNHDVEANGVGYLRRYVRHPQPESKRERVRDAIKKWWTGPIMGFADESIDSIADKIDKIYSEVEE